MGIPSPLTLYAVPTVCTRTLFWLEEEEVHNKESNGIQLFFPPPITKKVPFFVTYSPHYVSSSSFSLSSLFFHDIIPRGNRI